MISRVNPSVCLSVFIPLSLSLSLSLSPSLSLSRVLSLSAISSWNRSKSLKVQNVAKIDDLHIFCPIEITLIQCSMFDFHRFLRDLSVEKLISTPTGTDSHTCEQSVTMFSQASLRNVSCH